MSRLAPSETVFLYAMMVSFSLLLFVVGVYVGQAYSVESENPVPAEDDFAETQPTENDPALDFYSDLKSGAEKPGPPATMQEPPSGDSGSPEAGGSVDDSVTRPSQAISEAQPRGEAGRIGWTVQLGAVNRREDADRIIQRLEGKGYDSILIQPQVDSPDRYYRVWVGELGSRREALALETRLKADGFDTFVKRTRFP